MGDVNFGWISVLASMRFERLYIDVLDGVDGATALFSPQCR